MKGFRPEPVQTAGAAILLPRAASCASVVMKSGRVVDTICPFSPSLFLHWGHVAWVLPLIQLVLDSTLPLGAY